jgi:hypothetical protein
MTSAYERQELRIPALMPIRELPPYEADFNAACRVGKAVAAHTLGPWSGYLQISLEVTLSEP